MKTCDHISFQMAGVKFVPESGYLIYNDSNVTS